jgi:uncharacterized protein (DUF849 family)
VYFTDDTLLPENQNPLIITAAPWGPAWLPGDYPEDIAVSWDDQVQKAVDCYNAGATVLHVHVRDPQTGKLSKKMSDFNHLIERLRKAVPKMVLQVGGSISFAPENENDKAKWLAYDTRHMLAEITPKPDQVTVAIGSSLYDLTAMLTEDDVAGTHLADPKMIWNYSQMVADATPEFYIEHLKRLRQHEIQPYFALGHVHHLEIVERLIRRGLYMGPMNGFFSMVGGGVAGCNPFDYMELVRRTPHGSIWTYQSMMRLDWPIQTMSILLGQHCRIGIEENLWNTRKGERMPTVKQIEKLVRIARELGREIATPDDARRIMKIGTWYNSVEETLFSLGLPPNRKPGQQGFRVYETGGKLPSTHVSGSDGHPLVE